MASIGSEITASDFNTLQAKVEEMLGAGSRTFGFGQPVQSGSVSVGDLVTKEQWDKLRFDIVSIRVHQYSAFPNIVEAGSQTGGVIRYSSTDALVNYNLLIDQSRSNRFELGSGQFVLSTIGSGDASPTPTPGEYVYTSPWKNQAQAVVTATFSNVNEARYFFNSGSRIRISSDLTGATNKPQTNAWVTTLDSIGEIDFGADTDPIVNFYTLTNTYTPYYQLSLSSPYSANQFTLEAKCNVADNSSATATEVSIRITWNDGYVDPGNASPSFPPADGIDGTLILRLSEVRAAGTLYPDNPNDGGPVGNFTITPPSYSVPTISAT